MAFVEADICALELNPFNAIGKDWFLISAGTEASFNTMTASWGFMGVMWGKNVLVPVIRPNRHTFKFIEEQDCFSICFFDEKYRGALKFCGSHSGRDCDKVKETGLTPVFLDGVPAYEEARLVLICKKLYRGTVCEEEILDTPVLKFYQDDPAHVAYPSEILKTYKKA